MKIHSCRNSIQMLYTINGLIETISRGISKSISTMQLKIPAILYTCNCLFMVPLHHLPYALRNILHIVENDYFYPRISIALKAKRVVDIGAYLGFFAIHLTKNINRFCKVLCFEPIPINYEFLSMNIRINRVYSRVYTSKYAVCPSSGEIVLFEGVYGAISSVYREHVEKFSCVSRAVKVKCIGIRPLINMFKPIDLLKIDVEGLELDLLKSSMDLIQNYVKDIVIEVHEDIVDVNEITELLEKANYDIIVFTSSEMPYQSIVIASKNLFNTL